MTWKGFYINLDRAAGRRSSIESQLDALGLKQFYRRFPAVDGRLLGVPQRLTGSEVGIYASHLELIRRAAASDHITHIMEDDVQLTRHLKPFVDRLASETASGFDVLVTDTGFSCDARRFSAFRSRLPVGAQVESFDIQLLDISKSYLWGMTSYILSPGGARKLLAIAEGEWKRGPRFPIDVVLRKATQANLLAVSCTLPFLTWLNMECAQRTLSDRDQNHLVTTVQQLIRHPLYIGRNMNGYLAPLIRELLETSTPATPTAADFQAIRLANFLLSECEGDNAKRQAS